MGLHEKEIAPKTGEIAPDKGCLTRRTFLLRSGAVASTTIMLTNIPGLEGKAVAAEVTRYPKKLIGTLSGLGAKKPIRFKYPDEGKNSSSVLVRLGEPAGGGVGPDRDIVAFNSLCTHMGGDTGRAYQPGEGVLGPCPFHQSTFDLTRHGMIISGHGTESLPQVLLELDGDAIYAVGMIGLIYGRFDNLKS